MVKLEAAIERLQSDVTEVKTVLARIEPKLSEMFGSFPHLATKAQIAEMDGAPKSELARRPTVAGIIAIVGVIAALAAVPVWGPWLTAIRTAMPSGH